MNECSISSDRKTLKVVNMLNEKNTYYYLIPQSKEELVVTAVLIPTVSILSGTFVLVNNTYNFGEEKIRCSSF